MALIKTSEQIVSIRGRCGGVYFKHGPDGQHIQAMPRHVLYTHPPAQSPGIGGMSAGAVIWMLALLGYFASLWAAYALMNLFTTHSGEQKHITGFNWYIYYALQFPETVRPPFWMTPNTPSQLPFYIVTYEGMWTYRHTPPEFPAEAPIEYYYEYGVWNFEPTFKSSDGKWFIWWQDPTWVVSPAPGNIQLNKTYYSTTDDPVDKYTNHWNGKYCEVFLGNPPKPD